MIILDFGSGNTCKNDMKYIERMIDELKAVDTGKHEVVIKWQLFKDAPPNTPLLPTTFDFAYNYAKERGYKTTASVFDLGALRFLLRYKIPFVKIANRPDLYWLAGEVPRKIPVYVSMGMSYLQKDASYFHPEIAKALKHVDIKMACVSEYPATYDGYVKRFDESTLINSDPLNVAISDHTTNFRLFYKYEPKIIEWHYKLEDSTGLDAGEFARTPEQLKEIL